MLVWSGMFCPIEISAGMLSVARMCGVASTFESPSLAMACMTMPRAGMERPVPAASIVGPRTPSASASRLAGRPTSADCCGLLPPKMMASFSPSVEKGAPAW